MSPGNFGVFQLLKEVTFRRILVFCSSRKWGHLESALGLLMSCDWLVGLVRKVIQSLHALRIGLAP